MEEEKKGYSAEGRKLRPRRKVGPAASSNHDGEHRPYNRNGRNNAQGNGGYRSRDGYQSHDRFAPREGRPAREGYKPREGYQSREGYQGHDRYQSREGYQSHDRYPSRDGYKPREGYQSREGYQGRERHDRYESRDRFAQKDGFQKREGYRSRDHEYKSYGRNGGQGRDEGYRRPAAPRKPAPRKNTNHFTAADEAGINQMLSRRPQVDNPAFSDNDTAPTPIKEEIRLNKFIANSGVCSRREADTYIQAGVVTVNGEVVTELGTKINVLKDDVRFNGERLKGEEKVYIVMNKPKGYVTSASDPHAEKTVMDLLKGCSVRVFPVGRLDKNTTGILMFTNDGEIAEQLTHPSFNKKKIYQVILDKALDAEDKEKILVEGLELSDGVIKADELEYIDAEDHRRLGIEIHSGKNRIVRRIFESLGYTVKALDRVYFAGLTKKGLKKGEWRYLSEGEVNVLKMGAYV